MKTSHPVSAERRLSLGIELIALALAFALEAQAEPIFTIQPSPKETVASVGARVVNKVLASSTNGPIKYQWEKDGQIILNATNTTISLSSLQLSDGGLYTVVATDISGSIRSLPWIVGVNTAFTKITTDPIAGLIGRSTGVAVADINNDSFPDLFVSTVFTSNLLFTNSGGKGFVKILPNPVESGTRSTAGGTWGDYDNDGWPDLLVSLNAQANDLLYRNLGGGALKEVPATSFRSIGGNGNTCAWADYDGDGYLDVYVTNSDRNNFLYHNNGNGTFTQLTTNAIVTNSGNSQTCAWGDYDRDGLPDLFLGKGSANNVLFHNDGRGKFSTRPMFPMSKEGSGGGGTWVDFDNDGFTDLFVSNYGQKPFLYRNLGDDTFVKVLTGELVTESFQGTCSALSDFDND